MVSQPAGAAAKAGTVQNTVNSTPFRAFCVGEIYQKLLGRPATASEAASGDAELQAGGKAWQNLVVAVAGSPAYFQKTGKNNAQFVQSLFEDLVGRAPDAAEETPTSIDFLKANSRDKLAAVVADTEEFRAYWTQNFYQTWLGRAASQSEATASAAQLEAGGIATLASSVLASPAYFQKAGGSQSGWQNAVGATLQGAGGGEVAPVPAVPVDYPAPPQMPTGTMPTGAVSGNASRAPMVQALLSSPEYFAGTVQKLYANFWGRAATPAEAGQWLGELQNGATSDQILLGVLTSDEYFNRAGGTTTGYLSRLSQDLLGKPGGSPAKKAKSDLMDMLRGLPDRLNTNRFKK